MCGKVVFLSAFLRSVLTSKTETPLLRPFFNFAVFRWIPPIFHKVKFLRNSEKPPGEIPLFPSSPKYRTLYTAASRMPRPFFCGSTAAQKSAVPKAAGRKASRRAADNSAAQPSMRTLKRSAFHGGTFPASEGLPSIVDYKNRWFFPLKNRKKPCMIGNSAPTVRTGEPAQTSPAG